MPRIPFDAGNVALRPTEIGIEATAAAARRINTPFNQVAGALSGLGAETAALGNKEARAIAAEGSAISGGIEAAGGLALKYQEHRELTQGTAALAGFLDAKTKQWDDAVKSADPNDTTIAQNFRDGLETDFEKFRDGFLTEKGQQWADAHIASARQHFYQKTGSDMAALAGAALKNNVQSTADNFSNTAMRSPDFHTVDYLLGTVDSTVGGLVGSSPNIKGTDAAKTSLQLSDDLKRHIVKSGAVGAIQKSSDPVATAKAWGEKYPDLLSADDLNKLSKAADSQVRAQRTQENYDKRVAAQETKQRSAERLDELRTNLIDNPRSVRARDVINDPLLTQSDKTHALKIIEQAMKPTPLPARVSAKNYVDLTERINLPAGDPNRVTDEDTIHKAYGDGLINGGDYSRALKEFRENRTPDGETFAQSKRFFMDNVVKPQLVKGAFDPATGSSDMARYKKNMDDMIDAYRKEGKNPRELFNPKSPDYLGNPDIINGFKTPLTQQVEEFTKRMTPQDVIKEPQTTQPQSAPPPANERARKPGETPDAYLKRMGLNP